MTKISNFDNYLIYTLNNRHFSSDDICFAQNIPEKLLIHYISYNFYELPTILLFKRLFSALGLRLRDKNQYILCIESIILIAISWKVSFRFNTIPYEYHSLWIESICKLSNTFKNNTTNQTFNYFFIDCRQNLGKHLNKSFLSFAVVLRLCNNGNDRE